MRSEALDSLSCLGLKGHCILSLDTTAGCDEYGVLQCKVHERHVEVPIRPPFALLIATRDDFKLVFVRESDLASEERTSCRLGSAHGW